MRYEDIKDWKKQDFKRLIGVNHETFKKMLAVLNKELPNFGRPSKLSRADQLLMTLMYWREYRTQFHIAGSYGISEATVCRTINKVEDALVRSGEFSLPGKKVLQSSDTVIKVILVDVSEQPIERPKKSKNGTTAEKRSVTPKKHRLSFTREPDRLSLRLLQMAVHMIFVCSKKVRSLLHIKYFAWQMQAIRV